MTDATQSGPPGPFGQAAKLYRAAGWLGTIPLGREPGKKGPPLAGFTGHDGRYPDGGDIGTWLSSPLAGHNIGLRMPPGVIGLDIDAGYSKIENGKEVVKRGEDTLAELEAKWGQLPPTWVSSARPAPSGIRFYRVPEMLDGRMINWPGEAGKFIEIIQPGHRYAVVWPSTNPDAGGAMYAWRCLPDWPVGHALPAVTELAELPMTWVRGLALDYDRTQKADVAGGALGEWFAQLRAGDPCPNIHAVAAKAVAALAAVDGSRHETARDALAAVVRAAGDGHRGGTTAVGAIFAAFVAAVGEERARGGEWQRLVAGAIQLAIASNATPRQMCAHDIPPATGVLAGYMADFGQLALQQQQAASASTPEGPVFVSPIVASDLDAIIHELNSIPEHDERKAKARAYVRSVAGQLSATQTQEWRDRLKVLVGLTYGDFDRIINDAKREARNASVSRAATAAAGEKIVLPQPDAPLRVARDLVARRPDVHRRFWRDDFYTWTGSCYAITSAADIRSWVYRETEHAVYLAEGKDGPEEKFWHPTAHKVSQVIDALAHGALARPTADDQEECIALLNGVLDPVTRTLLPHDPARFNLTSLPFEYLPDATCPRWLAFLAEVLPEDSIRFLRQWFGYLVSGRTDMHKIANLVGAPRSGKGTIARLAAAVLGNANVTGPALPSLTETFGLEPLLGKSLAIFGDVKWSAHGVADATERLKTISGDDAISVHRKNRSAWEGHLPTRFMTLSNNTPTFTDSSGALASRMIHVHFTRSFAGRENHSLTDELLTELPGILLWALGGLDDLQAQGRFSVPAASAAIDAEVRLASAPHAMFVDDRCEQGPEARIPLDILWAAWQGWCAGEGATPGDKRWFARNLKDALPHLQTERLTEGGNKVRYVVGLALRHPPALPPAFPPTVTAGSSV